MCWWYWREARLVECNDLGGTGEDGGWMLHHHEEYRGCPFILSATKEQSPQVKTRFLKVTENLHRRKHVCKVISQYLLFVILSFNLNSVMLKCQSGNQCWTMAKFSLVRRKKWGKKRTMRHVSRNGKFIQFTRLLFLLRLCSSWFSVLKHFYKIMERDMNIVPTVTIAVNRYLAS